MDQQERNFFDDLGENLDTQEAMKVAAGQKIAAERLDYLIHKIFEQSADGKELITLWKESLILTATADDGMDSVAIGIREGMKRFIRGIILTIRRVENG